MEQLPRSDQVCAVEARLHSIVVQHSHSSQFRSPRLPARGFLLSSLSRRSRSACRRKYAGLINGTRWICCIQLFL